MAVAREDVLHVAALAQLAIPEERIPELVSQLNGILSHMDALREVDTKGVLPAEAMGDASLPLREDHGPPVPLARPLASFAPRMKDGFLLVPRLATHAGDETLDDELGE